LVLKEDFPDTIIITITSNNNYSYSELLGIPTHKPAWLLSFDVKVKNPSSTQRTKIFQITTRHGAHDCVTIYAETNTNQNIDLYVMKEESLVTVMANVQNNTRIHFQQISDVNCDMQIFMNNISQAILQGNPPEESFRMITTSPQNNFNINPITIEDGL